MRKSIQIFLIISIILTSIRFFEATFISKNILAYLNLLFSLIVTVISFPYIIRKVSGFIFPVYILISSIIFSIAMSYFSWGQSIFSGLAGTFPYLIWFFLFYLLHIKFPINDLENIILSFGLVYIVLTLFQLANYQNVMFGWSEEIEEQRGIHRFILGGNGLFVLSSYIAVTKITTQKKYNWIYITLFIFGLLMPLIQATRQMIAFAVIIYSYHFIKVRNFYVRVLTIGAIVATGIGVIYSDNKIIKGIFEVQKETIDEGDEYLRIQEANFFLNNFPQDQMTKIFGNGVPSGQKSEYAQYMTNLKNNYYFDLSDVGIIAVYIMFGIFAIIAYIIIFIKSFTIPLPKNYYYLKYYLWFILFTSATSSTMYGNNYLISSILVIYIYQYINEKQNNKIFKILHRLILQRRLFQSKL